MTDIHSRYVCYLPGFAVTPPCLIPAAATRVGSAVLTAPVLMAVMSVVLRRSGVQGNRKRFGNNIVLWRGIEAFGAVGVN